MKPLVFCAVLTGAALVAASASAWERIQTEQSFRDQVVGHRLVVDGHGHAVINADGSVSGRWDNQRVRGNWVWHDGYYCRNLLIGGNETGTNCQKIEIQGTQYRATNDRGQGSATISQME